MPKTAATKKAAPKPKQTSRPVIQTKSYAKLPSVWRLSVDSLKILWRRRWLFGGIVLFYGIVNLVVAQGFSSGLNVSTTKAQLTSLFQGHFSQLDSGLTIYALMLASLGGSSSNSGGGFGYSLLFAVIASLALIWSIRNVSNSVPVKIRDAYYRGIYPLIPFLAILLLIGIELLPLVAGISLYVLAINNTIAVTALEKLLFIVIMVGLSALSLFLISSSVFALFIVTLPEMTPVKALRSARDLVRKRRWPILFRLLYLPVALLIVSAIIMLPFIIFASVIAQWVFLALSLILLAIAVSYLYNLYREMLA